MFNNEEEDIQSQHTVKPALIVTELDSIEINNGLDGLDGLDGLIGDVRPLHYSEDLVVKKKVRKWPVFLFVGFNMLVSGYLTAVHRPFESGLVALLRSLVLPAGFLLLFYFLLSDYQFVVALSVAEGFAFFIAAALFFRQRPSKVLRSSR